MDNDKGSAATTKVLVPAGALGSGMTIEHVRYGARQGAHAIACDAGSTDSGPSYLACGVSKHVRESIKRDLHVMMQVASEARIPILIGSCATAGTDAGVDWTCEIAMEVANELGIKPRIALLYSEQSTDILKNRNDQGKIRPLPPAGKLVNEVISSCEHIVALMGPEPYIRAIEQGVDHPEDVSLIWALAQGYGYEYLQALLGQPQVSLRSRALRLRRRFAYLRPATT